MNSDRANIEGHPRIGPASGRHVISAIIPVYRDAARAVGAVRSLRALPLPVDSELEIVVVDDGSADGSAEQLRGQCDGLARFESLASNRGRSAARNAGATMARGDLLLFIDCDCVPASSNLLRAHASAALGGAVASCGAVTGSDDGFWDDYQVRASRRRATQQIDGPNYGGTTANLAVRRDAFQRIGGFDEAYRTYGFEDRDLLVRLARLGPVVWTQEAVVRHLDTLSLAGVCAKMALGGGDSGRVFAERHPEIYRRLGYAAIDTRLRPGLKVIARLMAPIMPLAIPLVAASLERRWLPFRLRAAAVRALSAANYLIGTASDTRQPLQTK